MGGSGDHVPVHDHGQSHRKFDRARGFYFKFSVKDASSSVQVRRLNMRGKLLQRSFLAFSYLLLDAARHDGHTICANLAQSKRSQSGSQYSSSVLVKTALSLPVLQESIVSHGGTLSGLRKAHIMLCLALSSSWRPITHVRLSAQLISSCDPLHGTPSKMSLIEDVQQQYMAAGTTISTSVSRASSRTANGT